MKANFIVIAVVMLICACVQRTFAGPVHDIIFCGERIPVQNVEVADKLMNVIRTQIPGVNLPQLRQRVKLNFPVVEYYLRKTGLPEDFKYLAIVESGFQNVSSSAGARGFWQLMPKTAAGLGLTVTDITDERDDIYKSTYAACKVLASCYLSIRKKYGVSSWVLTAAAYNFGIGNIANVIEKQGQDYFSMNLNPETAMYVYKIVAIKELFEYPELYMKDFGYNVFNAVQGQADGARAADTSMFKSIVVKVKTNDGNHPEPGKIVVKELAKPRAEELMQKPEEQDASAFKYLAALVRGRYKDFAEGQLVTIELLENMELNGSFNRKGSSLRGKGWMIDGRIFIDLGYGTHDVTLLDITGKKGLPPDSLKNDSPVLLKIKNSSD